MKCIDAISVEAENWIQKYSKLGYKVHLIAGKFGEPVDLPHLELPEIDYKHPEVRGVKSIIFGTKLDKQGKKAAEILLNNLTNRIKGPLKKYLTNNKIQILSVEDALVSMKNLPLNVALSDLVKDLNMPTISRFHYFPWDNTYFTKNDNFPKVTDNIPQKIPNIIYIANTDSARKKLNNLKKINARVIPNTINTDKLITHDPYNKDFRKDLGIPKDALIFMQPTRAKRNKSVEKAIRIVSEINQITKKDNILLITGSPVYQRGNYFEALIKQMKKLNVNVVFANDRVFLGRHENKDRKFYSIGDAYEHADFIIYPNTSDAFGNPVIEAAAYGKPLIVNRYPNLDEFLNKGLKAVVMENKLTQETISDIYEIIADPKKKQDMIENNLKLIKEHYSSDILDEKLIPILNSFEQSPGIMTRLSLKFFSRKPKNTKKKVKVTISLHNKKGSYKEPPQKKKEL
ncbi:glycosyltransferase family 4 protein [Nanoarchaeota archaeon]